MDKPLALAEQMGQRLTARKQTLAIAESSTGGLISAALLAVPGASAYFLGGAIVYTRESRRTLLDIPDSAFAGIRGVTEPLAQVLARGTLKRLATTWAVAEVRAAGPTGHPRGVP